LRLDVHDLNTQLPQLHHVGTAQGEVARHGMSGAPDAAGLHLEPNDRRPGSFVIEIAARTVDSHVAIVAMTTRFVEVLQPVDWPSAVCIRPFVIDAEGEGHRRNCDEGRAVDALKLLKDDHDRAKKSLEELDGTTERAFKTRHDLFAKLKADLVVHEAIEEEIFYPALREHAQAKEIVLEAYEEHNVVDTLMAEIEQTPFDDETWKAKFSVMKENLEHHIEEEEGEMFEEARDLFDAETLERLGEQMQARKRELQQAA
jgi:hypothetical protein